MKKKFTLYLTCLIVVMFAAAPLAFAQDQKADENKTEVKVPDEGKNINLKAGSSSLKVGDDSKKETDGEEVDAKAGDKAVKVKIDDDGVKVKTDK